MTTTAESEVQRPADRVELVLTAAVALLALMNVAPLLAWVSGLGSFASWFRFVTVPSLVGVAAIAVIAQRVEAFGRLRDVMVLGSVLTFAYSGRFVLGVLGRLGTDEHEVVTHQAPAPSWPFAGPARVHPLHLLVVGVALIPPALWEIFLLETDRRTR